MIEIWRDIKGYENEYQISTIGRLKSIKSNLIMKPMVATNGYLIACLWQNNKQHKITIHRLVADAFLPNPHGLPEINHIDEDKMNNNVENLEWCSHKYNMNYGEIKKKISESKKGKEPWNKGKRCPEISARQLGKPHPHGSTKKKNYN